MCCNPHFGIRPRQIRSVSGNPQQPLAEPWGWKKHCSKSWNDFKKWKPVSRAYSRLYDTLTTVLSLSWNPPIVCVRKSRMAWIQRNAHHERRGVIAEVGFCRWLFVAPECTNGLLKSNHALNEPPTLKIAQSHIQENQGPWTDRSKYTAHSSG